MRWFIFSIFLVILTACNNDTVSTEEGNFTISNLGVHFGAYDNTTGRAGDFIFSPSQEKVFLEFGAVVTSPDGTKELPTFEYLLDPDANVTAVSPGKIVRFVYQPETEDYEIGARSTQNSDFYVGYDHITSPTVAMGDTLTSGQVLGKPGTWDATYGRFEIMINNDATGLSYCPFVYFDPELKEQYRQKVSQLMRDWETYKNDSDIYKESEHVYPGCRYESMVTY